MSAAPPPRLAGPPAKRHQLGAVVTLAARLGLDPDRGPRRRWGVPLEAVTAPEAEELLRALEARAADRPAEQPPSLEAGPPAAPGAPGEAGPLEPEPDRSDSLTRAREAGPPAAPPPILSCHLAAAWSCDQADGSWPGAPAAFRAALVDYLAAWHRLMVASAHGLADTFDHADPLTAAADDALARCVALLPAGDLAAARRLEDLAIAMWREWCSAGRPGQAELVAAARLDTPGTPPARAKREFLEFAEAGSAAAGGLS